MTTQNCRVEVSVASSGNTGALILVVEDNSTNAKLMAQMLISAGYRVIVARDGREGLHRAQTDHPALLITDLQMPVMDGLELARRLKADPATAAIPIVAVTAHAMAEHREQALQAGCSCYLTKPVRYRSLVAMVEANLQPSSQGVS